jgi:flagellar hook-associated protein 3 FlgL
MPNPYRTYQSLLDFQRSKERLSVLSEQITRDKRITRISDDPTGAALIMDFETSIERNRMYVKQGESAASFLKGTESALNSIEIQIDRLLELGQQGLSDITGPRGREAQAAEVDGIFTILLDVSNTKEQGKYIFSGTKTQTLPFTAPGLPATIPPGGTGFGATYAGNDGLIDLDISPVTSVTTNLTGEWVFQGDISSGGGPGTNQDLFAAVRKLSDGMKLDDRAMIEDAYNEIREIKNRINVCLTNGGARVLSLENTAYNLEDFNEALQSIQNTYEAVDYPWTITQFAAEQSAQQASLSIIAKMGRNTLFDYIG